jgi:hypothetical protein
MIIFANMRPLVKASKLLSYNEMFNSNGPQPLFFSMWMAAFAWLNVVHLFDSFNKSFQDVFKVHNMWKLSRWGPFVNFHIIFIPKQRTPYFTKLGWHMYNFLKDLLGNNMIWKEKDKCPMFILHDMHNSIIKNLWLFT